MKSRLFWKILIGFWLTVMLITQGVWILLAFPNPPFEIRNDAADVEHFAITVAGAAIRAGGLPLLNRQISTWPAELRKQLTINGPERSLRTPGGTSTTAIDPGGVRYEITYGRRPHAFLKNPKYVALSVLGGLTFSAILAWYLTTPIWRMRVGFRRLAKGDFGIRLGPGLRRRHDEIADLAHDFDRMAERLEQLVKGRDRLLATVSHELRSPLARLQLAVGLARQEPMQIEDAFLRIEGEVGRLNDLVGELLTLSKLETGSDQCDEYFDLAHLLRELSSNARFEAGPRRVSVLLNVDEAPGDAWIFRGDARLVSHAIENVVRNAIRFSPEGGAVRIFLDQHENRYRLRIIDEGPGMSNETLETLFQAFPKGRDDSRSGFGLGLAIAHRAIQAHDGELFIRNGIQSGLIVTALLPILDGAHRNVQADLT